MTSGATVAGPAAGARTRLRGPVLVPALAVLLVAALLLGVSLGPTTIAVPTVWRVVVDQVLGRDGSATGAYTLSELVVVWRIRVPRVLLAAVVGAGLGLVGAAVQALVRNPLADPYLLGVSSGASLGAVVALVFGTSTTALAGAGVAGCAFAGALVAFVLVWAVARRRGGFLPLRLLLAGVAIGQILAGLTSYVVLQADDEQQVQGVVYWMLGSLGGAEFGVLALPAATVAAGLALLSRRARVLDALLMGDETAASLGVDVTRLRRELLVVTSLLTGILVAVSGAIGFVGLVVPHAARLVTGSIHRRMLPVCALMGALLLVAVDIVARLALAPEELPIGVVTAVLGGPVFLYLLDRRMVRG